MKSIIVLIALSVAAPAAIFASDSDKAVPGDAATMEGEGINLRMFSSRPTFGEAEDPIFWVHAKRGRLLDDPRVWTLEQAQAVIYRDPEEDIVLVAKTGTVDENSKAAQLDGGVHVTSGQFVADLADIHWDNETGVARSDAVATLDDGVNRMVGKSIVLYANEDRFELGEGSAHIKLAAATVDEPVSESKSPEFESISIPVYKAFIGNLTSGPREIRGPAELILNGVDPANTLNIKADSVQFEYDADSKEKMPSKIILKGHVALKHTAATFQANQGTVDLATRKVRFEGDIVMSGEQIEGATGDYFELNLDTGDFELGGEKPSTEKFWLITPKNAEKPADPKP